MFNITLRTMYGGPASADSVVIYLKAFKSIQLFQEFLRNSDVNQLRMITSWNGPYFGDFLLPVHPHDSGRNLDWVQACEH